jgi:hypothetical protein
VSHNQLLVAGSRMLTIILRKRVDRLPAQFMQVNKLFSHSVYKRFLPSDVIVKTVVTALGSWWYARMYKKSPSNSQQGKLALRLRQLKC